ncbi:MAG: hypothetical protein DMF68_18010 [Acidobacteria bacterium]|nr:MAG: hypothetical protein DMF68_18010 [Acidobacteriota bacterium]
MRKIFLCTTLVLLLHAASAAQGTQTQLKISLKHEGDSLEAQTRSQLQRLLSQYDCTRYIFTKEIIIDREAIPHSHPVLTLHTRHLKDDELLLSSFVHEQIHWFLTQHKDQTDQAIKELRTIFPKVPVGFPAGSDSEESTYLHLLVNTLEYRADRELLGELKAREVMEFWATDHYTWVYKQVLEEADKIRPLLRKYRLII